MTEEVYTQDFVKDYVDDIPKCECGCEDIVVESTAYLWVTRKDGQVAEAKEGDEADVVMRCQKCEKVLRSIIDDVPSWSG